jgi:hypothetical protein
MARMDEKIHAQRDTDDETFLASADIDPTAFAKARAMKREALGLPIPADGARTGDEVVDPNEDNTPVEAFEAEPTPAPAERVARPAERISTKGEDPLGKWVVRKDGKPMFKTLVNGEERLIPLEDAHRTLQKQLSADIRLQQAAEQRKHLEAREAALRQNEEIFKRRQQPTAPAAPAFDDRKLATELVRSLVTDTEDKAAERMAETFKAIRQAATPQIDQDALIQQATDRALKTIADERNRETFATSFEKFTADYPDIAGDSDLFKVADNKSEVIAAEHPDWKPHQIMDEAGRQTRAWLASMGATAPAAPKVTTSNQQRKQNLVPMPKSSAMRPAPAAAADRAPTPAEIVAEIRKSRAGV